MKQPRPSEAFLRRVAKVADLEGRTVEIVTP
jgi:hypothetical protein